MKYAVVTGSTKGIGKAIAEMLLSKGWYVICNYANDDAAAESFRAAHQDVSERFSIIKMSLSTWESALMFINAVRAITDSIDCFVSNTGATDRTPFEQITQQGWESVLTTNLTVPFVLARGFRDLLPEHGRIIFIGSVCGKYPHARSPAYGVSKAGLHQLSKELVKFYVDKHITVNAVVPSFVETPWQEEKSTEHKQRVIDKLAQGRFARAEEIASFCWEVINNDFINGSVLDIDGGYCYR